MNAVHTACNTLIYIFVCKLQGEKIFAFSLVDPVCLGWNIPLNSGKE
jgi:hypothetical protein